MFEAPEVMRMAQELARHSGTRQSMIARNIANSDTPGFRASDLSSFESTYKNSNRTGDLRMTRQGHQSSLDTPGGWRTVDVGGTPSPNGNTVSLEDEMVRATRANSNHTLALTIYSSSLDILRTTLGRGR
jgi:flagellar basal-body rod protein FlgB